MSIMFIDANSGGKLACLFKEALDKVNLWIKLADRLGTPIKSLICKIYSFDKSPCMENNSVIFRMNPQVKCKIRNVICSLRCRNKTATYIRETTHSIGKRIGEHWQEFKEKKSFTVLYQYVHVEHRS